MQELYEILDTVKEIGNKQNKENQKFMIEKVAMSVKFNVKGHEIIVNCGNPDKLFKIVELLKKEAKKRLTEVD